MRSVRNRNKISLFFSDPCEIITLIFNASKLNYIPTFIVDGHKKHKKKILYFSFFNLYTSLLVKIYLLLNTLLSLSLNITLKVYEGIDIENTFTDTETSNRNFKKLFF